MKTSLWNFALGVAAACAAAASAQTSQPVDYIVAVVNSEPVTQSEVLRTVSRTRRDMLQQGVTPPSDAQMRRRVLDRLIDDRAQLQHAQEVGIKVDDAAVDQAEQAVARQNQIDVAELRSRVQRDGMTVNEFRSQLREQITLTRLHEREVQGRLRVSESDVDAALQERNAAMGNAPTQEINLAHLLISVPEGASVELVAQREQLARAALERARRGEDFTKLVGELSSGDRSNGGELGLRRQDRYPPAFVQATQALDVGAVSELVRTAAGFHLLKLVQRKSVAAQPHFALQTRARHILLRTSPSLSQAAASARLAAFKARIESGAATFEALAREHSQDGSAPQGGDLGWTKGGAFVPEFEEPMNKLAVGQISAPVVSRFGVHLIQVQERRRVELSEREVRDQIRAQLRASKYDDAFAAWAREIRANAFVELRDPPSQ